MQVDPIKPTLKAPGTERLKLEYEDLLSIFGVKSNLRRYTLVNKYYDLATWFFVYGWAGAYTRSR